MADPEMDGPRGGGQRTTWIVAGATVAAAVIGGVFALVAARIQAGDGDRGRPLVAQQGRTQQGSPTRIGVVRDDADAAESGAPSQGPAPATRTSALLTSDGLDLDLPVPTKADQSDINYYSGGYIFTDSGTTVARWEDRSTPSEAQCNDKTTRFGLSSGSSFSGVGPGFGFCMKTDQGNTAFIRVRSVTEDGARLNITVWGISQGG